jgi:hypothetical protein
MSITSSAEGSDINILPNGFFSNKKPNKIFLWKNINYIEAYKIDNADEFGGTDYHFNLHFDDNKKTVFKIGLNRPTTFNKIEQGLINFLKGFDNDWMTKVNAASINDGSVTKFIQSLLPEIRYGLKKVIIFKRSN